MNATTTLELTHDQLITLKRALEHYGNSEASNDKYGTRGMVDALLVDVEDCLDEVDF